MMPNLNVIATRVLWRLGIAKLAQLAIVADGRFVLMFHGISKQKNSNIPSEIQPYLTINDLRKVIGWIKKHFSFLSPDEFLYSNKKGVLLTFDDGMANNFTNALPLLTKFNAPGILFVSTQHVINPKDWLPAINAAVKKVWGNKGNVPDDIAADFYDGISKEQLVACVKNPLITIGSHTVSHPFLTQCGQEQLKFELTESKRFLEELIEKRVDFFAYPSGDYNRKVIETLQVTGYQAAFTGDPLRVGFPVFEIPRVGIYCGDSAYLSLKLSGLHRRPIKGPIANK